MVRSTFGRFVPLGQRMLMVIGSLIAIRLAGCPEALRMSRPYAPHPVPSLSLECVEPLRARCPHAPWCLPNFDSAKVLHF